MEAAEENGAPPDARAGKTAGAGAGAAAGTAAADGARSGADGTGRQAQVGVVLAAVFITYVGQSTLNPVIAPLSRLVGLKEWQIGLTISVAALMVVLTSQAWGKRSQSMGRKPVLVIALAVAAVSMGVFALVSHLGVTGALSGAPLFALFVIVRGVVFGAALAAVLPTAQACIADATTTEESRVRGMAGVGAAQGLASIAGALIGGALSGLSLLVSVDAVPVFLLIGLLVVAVALRKESRTALIAKPARVSPRDPRVWPYLVAGFGMFSALGLVQVVTGFLVQDRLGLDADTTGLITGGALLAAGVGMVLAQSVIVPLSKWAPPVLLRAGALTAAIGFGLLLVDAGLAALIASVAIIGVGIGTAMPGYTAGPTLRMSRDEQGGLAGLIGATNGLTYVVAPTLGTFLYGVAPALPIVIGAAMLVGVLVFVCAHSGFRRPTGQGAG